MKAIEDTMPIIQLENNYIKISVLEEIEMLKATSSRNLLNDVINGKSDTEYKLLPSVI